MTSRQRKLDTWVIPSKNQAQDQSTVEDDFSDVLDRIQRATAEDEDEVWVMEEVNTTQRTMREAVPLHTDPDCPTIRPRETAHRDIKDVFSRFQIKQLSARPARVVSIKNNPSVSVQEAEKQMLERIRAKHRKKAEQQQQ